MTTHRGILGYFGDGSPFYARVGLRWIKNPSTGYWDYTLLQPLPGHDTAYAERIDAYGNIIGKSSITDLNTLQPSVQAAVRWSRWRTGLHPMRSVR